MNRLSISVRAQTFREVVHDVGSEGWTINIWDVRDATQFRDALGARPSSITADLGILDPRDFLSERGSGT